MKTTHSIKHLSQAAKGTTKELDGVIKALGGTYIGPKTIVTYQNETTLELDISGIASTSQFPDNTNITKVKFGTKVTGIESQFTYGGAFSNISEMIIPKTLTSIAEGALFLCKDTVIYTFLERTKANVQAMPDYPWGAGPHDGYAGNTFRCTDGDLILT